MIKQHTTVHTSCTHSQLHVHKHAYTDWLRSFTDHNPDWVISDDYLLIITVHFF